MTDDTLSSTWLRRSALVAILISLAFGCASTNDPVAEMPHPDPVLPEWVSNPYVPGGMAQTSCEPATAPMSILKGKAEQLARASLASQLQVGIEDMKVNYQELRRGEGDSSFSENYDRITKSLLQQTLTGSRPARVDYVTVDGEKNLCVMVVIDETNTKRLKEEVFATTGMNVSEDEEEQLWQQFLLAKSSESLAAERERKNVSAGPDAVN